jgi:hypothetical protein
MVSLDTIKSAGTLVQASAVRAGAVPDRQPQEIMAC